MSHGGVIGAVAAEVSPDSVRASAQPDGATALERTYHMSRVVAVVLALPWMLGLLLGILREPAPLHSPGVMILALVVITVVLLISAARPDISPAWLIGTMVVTSWICAIDQAPAGLADPYPLVLSWSDLAAAIAGIVARTATVAVRVTAGLALTQTLTLLALGIGMPDQASWRTAVAVGVYCFSAGASAAVIAFVLRRAARRLDRAVVDLRVVGESRRKAEEQMLESFRLTRILHDTIINTMAAVRLGLPGSSRETLQRRCRSDLHVLEQGRMHESGPAEFAALRAEQLGLTLTVVGSTSDLPSGVRDDVNAIIGECLVNVAKHSGVTEARLELTETRDMVSVSVSDLGSGWDGDLPASGGISRSIVQRAAAIGWDTQVHTAPGRGTLVRLSHRRTPESIDALALIRQESRLAVGLIGSILVAVSAVVTAIQIGEYPLMWSIAALAIGAVVTAVAWNTAREHFPLPAAVSALIAVAALPLLYLPGGGIEGCARVGWPWWGLIGSVIAFVPLILLVRDDRWVVLALGMQLLAMAAMYSRFADQACGDDVVARTVVQLAVVCGLLMLRSRLTVNLQAVAVVLDRTRSAWSSVAATEESRRQWQQRVQRAVPASSRDLLAALADGSARPEDPQVRAQAAREEAFLRGQILVPAESGAVGVAVADFLTRAHERGVLVTLRASQVVADPGPGVSAALHRVMMGIAEALELGSSVTLTLADDGGSSRLTLVTDRSVPAPPAADGLVVSHELLDEQCIVELTWPS